jgi:hypothetical protein
LVRTDRHNQDGAVLILALVFLVAVSTIVIALLGFAGNDLKNVANFQQGRTLKGAADSAMEVAIQEVRYSSTACPSSGLVIPIPNPNSSNDVTIRIWCNPPTETESPTAASRVITFQACSESAFQNNQCSPTNNPYLTTIVTFDDFASSNLIASTTPCTTTCGASESINSWVFN